MTSLTQENIKSAASPAAEISRENYAFLQQQVYKESGIVLDETKSYLFESRLIPIVRKQGLTNLNDLCALLRANTSAPIRQQVVEAMTTNETLFFRDAAVFDSLQSTILPQLIEQRKGVKKLSFWSAASSTGQEAYSLAMMLLEMGLQDWRISIVGTDLNEQILERARGGRFLQIEVNRGLPAKYLVKYFTRAGLEWEIKDEVRKMVRFERFDLRQSMSAFGPFDLVFCRNVLIYFDLETKRKILREMRGTLYSQALLLLGSAETTLNVDDQYIRKMLGTATFYQAP